MNRLLSFGRLALVDPDGGVVEAVRGRNLALLALLARAGSPGLTREKIAAYLWPESSASRARHSLDQALYTIRRALHTDPFVTGASTLALRDTVIGSDVAQFVEALERAEPDRAVEHYGGDFLDGFHLSGAAEFERWVDGERSELQRQFAGALEALATAAAERGDHAAAVEQWRRLSTASPLSSRVVLELMNALDRAGDPAEAIRAARVHAALVEEELNAPAHPAVLALERALRERGEPAAGPELPADPELPAASGATAQPTPEGGVGPGSAALPRRRGLLAASLLIIAAMVMAWRLAPSGPTADTVVRPQVVVLHFANRTGDPDLDVLAELSADWIIQGLARTGMVDVMKGNVGRSGGSSVVEGAIFRIGDSLGVQARVVDPGNGEVIRALETVMAHVDTPSAVLEPLRQHVLGAMGTLYDPRLADWAGTALRPPSYDAYRAFAAGVEHHAVPRNIPAAIAQFRRAIELDRDYMVPRLWLAWSLLMADDFPRADSMVAALQPDRQRLAPAERAWYDRIAALIAGDNEASYRAARRLVDLAPRSGWVIALANAALATNRPAVAVEAVLDAGLEHVGLEREQAWSVLTAAYHRLGEHEQELAAAEEAIRTDGLDWGHTGPGIPVLAALGRIDALERRLEQLNARPPAYGMPLGPVARLTAVRELRVHGFAEQSSELGRRLVETTGPPSDPVQRMLRVELLYELGQWREAEQYLGNDTPDDFRTRALAGLLAARQGKAEVARAAEEQLAALNDPYLFGEPAFWRARIAAVLGHREEALDLLRRSFREGRGARGYHDLHVVRDFHGLREDPAFIDLLEPH